MPHFASPQLAQLPSLSSVTVSFCLYCRSMVLFSENGHFQLYITALSRKASASIREALAFFAVLRLHTAMTRDLLCCLPLSSPLLQQNGKYVNLRFIIRLALSHEAFENNATVPLSSSSKWLAINKKFDTLLSPCEDSVRPCARRALLA